MCHPIQNIQFLHQTSRTETGNINNLEMKERTVAPRIRSSESDREPVDNLGHGHKADPEAKSTEAAKAGDEVQPGHLWQPLVL